MSKLQKDIADLIAGRHKQWHVLAMKTTEHGDFGRRYLSETHWEFILGFDWEADAKAAIARLEVQIRENSQYGADEYEFALIDTKEQHG